MKKLSLLLTSITILSVAGLSAMQTSEAEWHRQMMESKEAAKRKAEREEAERKESAARQKAFYEKAQKDYEKTGAVQW